ncbi:MAG: hypothetical protein EOP06_05200 [Proteobacteria bacterium]|nr:MAG: hypothetical protein EOP06_05200 [Pseudomonadota bacterium]
MKFAPLVLTVTLLASTSALADLTCNLETQSTSKPYSKQSVALKSAPFDDGTLLKATLGGVEAAASQKISKHGQVEVLLNVNGMVFRSYALSAMVSDQQNGMLYFIDCAQ